MSRPDGSEATKLEPGPEPDDPGCVFCQIVAGRLSAHLVLVEPDVVGFLDRRPLFHGHTLLVPRRHRHTLPEVPTAELAPLMDAAQRVAAAMVDVLGAQGSFVAMNNTVSQSVPHLHVHVVPRTKGDGLRGFFWPRTTYADDAEMSRIAGRIAAAL
ncbi:MAG: HIT family protein [Actinomycetales bacterium]